MKKLALLAALLLPSCGPTTPPAGELVLLVTTDGLRWQEVFHGPERELMDPANGRLMGDFWKDTRDARREALMPFLWGTMAKQGRIWGNQDKGSTASVVNTQKFSYPGYSELLCGFPDSTIDSNAKTPNWNVSVLEWLNGRPGFEGRVAAFGTWDVLPFILNRERSKLHIVAGGDPLGPDLTEREKTIQELRDDTTDPFHGNPLDGFTFHAAVEYMKRARPRVLFVLFGETDEWAHEGKYELYLRSARRVDGYVRRLYEAAKAVYGDRVSLVFSTDHGRGTGAKWISHSPSTEGAEHIWIAAMGAKIGAKGALENGPAVTQSQIAATIAALAGEDYVKAVPRAAAPLPLLD